jgi:N-acetylglucosamine-6-phosphate deacetylase
VIIEGGRLVTDRGVLDPGWLEVHNGVITAVGHGRPPAPAGFAFPGHWLVPGFVDMHVHGGGGGDFSNGDPNLVTKAVEFHRAHGTTTMVAGLVTAPLDELVAAVARLAEHVQDGVLAGLHLEGPYLSAAHCGAHPPALLRAPEPGELERLLEAGRGTVRMITVAPELPHGIDAIHRVAESGVIAAVGHTAATYEQTLAAIDAGATVATHLGNGMAPPHHRRPGPSVALLEADHVTVEVIVDGHHLHPATVRAIARSAGPNRVALITDAIAAAGLSDGDYTLGTIGVRVRDGIARLSQGDSLAGSTLTLDRALRNAVAAGLPFLDALAAITTVPASAVGLADRAGVIGVRRRADLVVLDHSLEVVAVLADGAWLNER